MGHEHNSDRGNLTDTASERKKPDTKDHITKIQAQTGGIDSDKSQEFGYLWR